MSENTAPVKDQTTNAAPVKEDVAKVKKAAFDALPDTLKEAIQKINSEIETHNVKVDSLKASEAKDTNLIKAEIFEQQTSNKEVARLYTEYQKLIEAAEKLRMNAYVAIDKHGLMPKNLSEEEVTKLKGEVTTSTKEIRQQIEALETFQKMMPTVGNLTEHIDELKTRRGGAAKTTTSGEGIKRPRFKRIEINGVTQDDKGNTVYKIVDGDEKYTFTFAALYLGKQHKGINWTSGDLQEAYFKSVDPENLPDESTFTMPYVYKDGNGNEQTVNYEIKTYR